MRRVLVTGANGFVGQHLTKELSDNGLEVIGVGGKQGSGEKPGNLTGYLILDLLDKDALRAIDFQHIDYVVHLAGLAAVGPSFDDPMQYINTNIGIEANLFEAALAQNAKPRFLIISSGALYDSKAPLPLSETSAVVPSSPYAVSKLGQEQMAQYYERRSFEIIIARPFNHIGPGQNPGFIVPDLAQQIVAFERGKTAEVMVGNLDAKRDYTDVRDIARAYRLLLKKGHPGETYNICSGLSHSGHDILKGLLRASGAKPSITQDLSKMRPSDTPEIYGNPEKLASHTGWHPEISLEDSLRDAIADWRNRK